MVQGLTEFLPVSSSGHLVLFQHLFGIKEPALVFDIGVHVGTLGAVLYYFRSEIASMLVTLARAVTGKLSGARQEKEDLHMIAMIAAGSVPTAAIGLLLKDDAERLFSSVALVGAALLVTAALLVLTRIGREKAHAPHGGLNLVRAIVVGLIQGMAIIPGISRSGATIASGLLLGVQRETAARFSFLLSIPAVGGAGMLGVKDLLEGSYSANISTLLLGTVISMLVGYAALWMLVAIVNRGKMHLFAPYCAVVGVIALLLKS